MAKRVGEMTLEEFSDFIFSIFSKVLSRIADSIVATLEELLNMDTMRFVEKSREDIREGRLRRARIEEIDDILK